MKATTIVVGIALVAAGVTAAVMLHKTPAQTACADLERLCGPEKTQSDCVAKLERASENELEDVLTCVEPAETCGEAVVCIGGAMLRDMGEGFFRGLTETR